MLFRSLVAVSALLVAAPALAQESAPQPGDRADIATAAAAFVKPTNAERTQVRPASRPSFRPSPAATTAPARWKAGMSSSPWARATKDIVLTAHYDAVKLRDGTLSQGIVDNVG